MPELPEVETTCRGISPHITGQRVIRLLVRNSNLRWKVSALLPDQLQGLTILEVQRRAKYLLLDTNAGTLIIHLGMSGSLRLVQPDTPPQKHDHIDLLLSNGLCLRYCDPRRFGCWLWTQENPETHPLLKKLGPEPLSRFFSGRYLELACLRRTQAIKNAIMDSHLVVGVGNIYANEALFLSGIRPDRKANSLSHEQYRILCQQIKHILKQAIKQGGTTLRDYVNGHGAPGYFALELQVYGRGGQPCTLCSSLLLETRLGQRSSVFCPCCQT